MLTFHKGNCRFHNTNWVDFRVLGQNKFDSKIDSVKYALIRMEQPTCENLSSGFPIRSDINRTVQPQEMARGLKNLTWKVP